MIIIMTAIYYSYKKGASSLHFVFQFNLRRLDSKILQVSEWDVNTNLFIIKQQLFCLSDCFCFRKEYIHRINAFDYFSAFTFQKNYDNWTYSIINFKSTTFYVRFSLIIKVEKRKGGRRGDKTSQSYFKTLRNVREKEKEG